MLTSLSHHFRSAAIWSAIALGFAIPISTAASNIFLALTLLFFLLSGAWMQCRMRIAAQPLALASLVFCALALLGCLWGLGSAADKQHYLGKYLSLLAIPVLMPLFGQARHRRFALAAFCAAMLLTLLISTLLWLGWLDGLPPEIFAVLGQVHDPEFPIERNAVVFKLSITHGFFMALAAFLLLQAACHATTRGLRIACGVLALLAASNVLFMIIGRTGYVVLAVLGGYFFVSRFGRRSVLAGVLGCALIGVMVWGASETLRLRAEKGIAEAQAWQPGKGDKTSIGLRLDYYSNTLSIIREHPLWGVGTGGFAAAYGQRVQGTAMAPSSNPHNQYLLTTAQFGALGLLMLLGFYVIHWRESSRLSEPYRHIAHGVLLAYVTGNLFNSFMYDFSERMFFVWISGVLLAELSAQQTQKKAQTKTQTQTQTQTR